MHVIFINLLKLQVNCLSAVYFYARLIVGWLATVISVCSCVVNSIARKKRKISDAFQLSTVICSRHKSAFRQNQPVETVEWNCIKYFGRKLKKKSVVGRSYNLSESITNRSKHIFFSFAPVQEREDQRKVLFLSFIET